MIRLDKFLTDHNFGTRSEVKEIIKKGQVKINGEICKKTDFKFDPEKEQISVGGTSVSYEEFAFYLLNKPAGIITASLDRKQKTVMDLFADEMRTDLFPVGRLDKDTVGLLLITNHGALCHKMLAPKSHVDKVYYVGLANPLSEEARTRLEAGVEIEKNTITKPAKCELTEKIDCFEGSCAALLTITEGKFHQVKRMFEAVGNEVVYLKRLSFGPLTLDPDLPEGHYRKCTEEEIKDLLALL